MILMNKNVFSAADGIINNENSGCRIIQLPRFLDPRGNLSVIGEMKEIPFAISRTYWIYDVPGGESRGGHAYHSNEEFVVALSGSFDVEVDDGSGVKTFSLNRSYYGLFIPKLTWRRLTNFSTNSLALILASNPYDEEDYIRNRRVFKKLCSKK